MINITASELNKFIRSEAKKIGYSLRVNRSGAGSNRYRFAVRETGEEVLDPMDLEKALEVLRSGKLKLISVRKKSSEQRVSKTTRKDQRQSQVTNLEDRRKGGDRRSA